MSFNLALEIMVSRRGLGLYFGMAMLVGMLLVGSGCTRVVYKNNPSAILVSKHTIKLASGKDNADVPNMKYDLQISAKPKPNRKLLLFFHTRMWLYEKTLTANRGVKKWLHTRVGEPPSLLDGEAVEAGRSSMESYLHNKGFLDASVGYKIDTSSDGKRASVVYDVRPYTAYRIDSVHYQSDDAFLFAETKQAIEPFTYLKKGQLLDAATFQAEKNRIVNIMRNHGYANFSSVYLDYFSEDSTAHRVDVVGNILKADSLAHKRYQIQNIIINLDYRNTQQEEAYIDTLKEMTANNGIYYYLFKGDKIPLERFTIKSALRIRPGGQTYNQTLIEETYNNFVSLGIYSFISIKFKSNPTLPDHLDCFINLTPAKRMAVGASIEGNFNSNNTVGSSSSTSVGTALSLSFLDKNMFKGAEQFSISAAGGVDLVGKALRNSDGNDTIKSPFNNIDITLQSDITLPRMFPPVFTNRIKRSGFEPKSKISTKFNYLNNIRATESSLFNISYGFEFNKKRTDPNKHIYQHTYNPLSINYYNLIATKPAFDSILIDNPLLKRSYEDQFFIGSNYTYYHTKENLNNTKSSIRIGADVSGNLMSVIDILRDKKLTILNIPYSHYLKTEAEYRYSKTFGRNLEWASRIGAGIAIPIGDSAVVPFVKQFAVGGANSLRGWRIRQLGPGGYNSTTDNANIFYQTGDMKLEVSTEVRFPLFSYFRGALFLDAGNIWLLNEDTNRPNSGISTRFLNQIAMDTGIGFRLDLSYFVIRADVAFPIRNPYKNDAGKYMINLFENPFSPPITSRSATHFNVPQRYIQPPY
jgi:outer membrane protein assembly factor BamA